MQPDLSFADVVRTILRDHPVGMTPQEIREVVKVHYPEHYGTESHLRNVQNGNYKDVDHAVLARIYLACRNARDIFADKSQKPHRMSLEASAGPTEVEAEDFIEGENLEKLADDIGTLYVLGTNLFTADGIEIIKIGITTGPVDKRIAHSTPLESLSVFGSFPSWRPLTTRSLSRHCIACLIGIASTRLASFSQPTALVTYLI